MPKSVAGDLQHFKAEFFRALAHPVRIEILEVLLQGEHSVQELQDALGLEQSVVSQQLAVLRTKNIVSGRKEGTSVRYTVRDPLIGARTRECFVQQCRRALPFGIHDVRPLDLPGGGDAGSVFLDGLAPRATPRARYRAHDAAERA